MAPSDSLDKKQDLWKYINEFLFAFLLICFICFIQRYDFHKFQKMWHFFAS